MDIQKRNQHKDDDTYGILKQETEVDTDINEDPIREKLLDESLDDFLYSKREKSIESIIKPKRS